MCQSTNSQKPDIDPEITAYSSITDGQPGTPGKLEFGFISSIQSDNQCNFQSSLSFTPNGVPLVEKSLFTFTLPTIDVGEGIIDVEKSMNISWQQLWIYTNHNSTAISTLLSAQFPMNKSQSETDWIATFILTKKTNSGVLYLNAYFETQNGIPKRQDEWGLIGGFKLPLNNSFAAIGDIYYQSTDIITLEMSTEINIKDNFSIGPGFFMSFPVNDEKNSIDIGAGFELSYEF
ncbi:hypothetical protein AMJ80_08330 [bacterium SM23_31]|nr:MAG: hypothetical protein AMJ80_08330 [bacterium SM23_31]